MLRPLKLERTVFDEQELIQRANDMKDKILLRKGRGVDLGDGYRAIPMKDFEDKTDPIATGPKIHKCRLERQGNFTLVILNDMITSFAKFNPNDKKMVQLKKPYRTRRGTLGPKVEETKYSVEAGINKALHRAVNKLLEPFSR